MTIHPNISQHPIELWEVKYAFLGWTVTARNAQLEQAISYAQAMHIVGMIRRATEICAMPASLARIDNYCRIYWDEQQLLAIEADENDTDYNYPTDGTYL